MLLKFLFIVLMLFSWVGCFFRSFFSVFLLYLLIVWNIFEVSVDVFIFCKRKIVLCLNDLKGNLIIKFESWKCIDIIVVLVFVFIVCFMNEFDEILMRYYVLDIN